MSEVGKVFAGDATHFAITAVRRAVADAGLYMDDVDGLLVSWGTSGGPLTLGQTLGLRDLKINTVLNSFGATSGVAIQYASMAVASGMASTIVYVHADAPLANPAARASDAYGRRRLSSRSTGFAAVTLAAGITGANHTYAIAARRHMHAYGTTEDDFGAVAVAQRRWATLSPHATMRMPISIEDHHASRWIAEPLRLLDCCLVSNGAVAVVVTSAERSRDLPRPPVYVWGWGQSHPGYTMRAGCEFGLRTGAEQSGRMAMGMAGISPRDVDLAQIYDCYTYTVLVTLEDYGFCAKGEAGEMVRSGATSPGGRLPVNTGGGQLSGYYLWGATPLSEAVMQLRGEAGDRQVARHEVALVSGNGGTLDHHSSLVLAATQC
jgi:acetyl-CoA acetyltransferase